MSRPVEPPRVPASSLGGLRWLRRDPIGLFESAASLGDVVRIPFPRVSVYLLNRPDLAREVLVTRARGFRKSPALRNARRVLGEGLLTSEGDLHRRQRRLIQPLFHHERIATYAATFVAAARDAAARWEDGAELDVHAEMARLTLSIVGRTLFGVDLEDRSPEQIARALRDVLDRFDRLFSPLLPVLERLPLPSTVRYRRAKAVFDRTVADLIATRRTAGPDGDDLLSLLIRARDEEGSMDDRQLRDEAVTLLLAGHETTANAIAWTWHLLGSAPEAERSMHDELDAVLRSSDPTIDDLGRLPVVDATFRESLRLRPPAWALGREATHPFEADGVRIGPGSVVVVSQWLLHRDPRWWGRDALVFQPRRWIEGPEPERHAFLPFGAGPRMCIGEGFAMAEGRLLLATLARRWRFEPDPSHRVQLQPVITLRPRTGIRMRARARVGRVADRR
jgi:cytochrome P450